MIEIGAEEAERFLSAGGILTLTDWQLLSDESREAFSLAGERYLRARSALVGLATRSAEDAVFLASGISPEAVVVRRALIATVGAVSQRLEAEASHG